MIFNFKSPISLERYISLVSKKNKRFIISNFLEWDMRDLLSKHQVASKVMIFLISILFVNSVSFCVFSLGKIYITGKVYLSNFQKRKRFMISNFLEWDMHVLLSNIRLSVKWQIFLSLYCLSLLYCIVHFH